MSVLYRNFPPKEYLRRMLVLIELVLSIIFVYWIMTSILTDIIWPKFYLIVAWCYIFISALRNVYTLNTKKPFHKTQFAKVIYLIYTLWMLIGSVTFIFRINWFSMIGLGILIMTFFDFIVILFFGDIKFKTEVEEEYDGLQKVIDQLNHLADKYSLIDDELTKDLEMMIGIINRSLVTPLEAGDN